MARSEHLLIYKASYDLCLHLELIVRNFSRYHKYTLGSDLRDGARRILKLVVRANSRHDRRDVLLGLREEVEELKVMLRLSCDARAFAKLNSFEQRFVEFYGPQRLFAENVLGLRRARLGRGGYGFPRPLLRRFVLRALATGAVVAFAGDGSLRVGAVMQADPDRLLTPVSHLTATGLSGEPTAPFTLRGGAENRNS